MKKKEGSYNCRNTIHVFLAAVIFRPLVCFALELAGSTAEKWFTRHLQDLKNLMIMRIKWRGRISQNWSSINFLKGTQVISGEDSSFSVQDRDSGNSLISDKSFAQLQEELTFLFPQRMQQMRYWKTKPCYSVLCASCVSCLPFSSAKTLMKL